MKELIKFLFSFEGRINRKQYWIVHLPLLIFFTSGHHIFYEWEATKFVFSIPFMWPTLVNQVKRWHDRNKSGTWVFINFIPILGPMWAFIELGFFPGTPETNRFDPGYRDDERNYSCPECDFTINYYDLEDDELFCTECGTALEFAHSN